MECRIQNIRASFACLYRLPVFELIIEIFLRILYLIGRHNYPTATYLLLTIDPNENKHVYRKNFVSVFAIDARFCEHTLFENENVFVWFILTFATVNTVDSCAEI